MASHSLTENGSQTVHMNGDQYASIVDTVYNQLKSMILRRELLAGQKLSEVGLSEQFSVSRTPVREALRRLANDGFAVIVPKSGVWIASPSPKEVEDAYATRGKLEVWAAAMAVHNVTPLFLARLDEKIREEDAIFNEKDIERYLEVNTAYHMIIAEASGNSILMEYISDILAKTFIYMVFLEEKCFNFKTNASLEEHCRLLDAFSMKDEALTVYLMNKHVKAGLANLELKRY